MATSVPLRRRLTRHFLAFGVILVVVFGGLGAWGATVPIASAAIAGGQIAPAGLRMTVQHLEGGIVKEILVHEGDEVVAGQPLIVFDGTRAEANLDYDQTQMMRVEAMKFRLEAHQNKLETLTFPPDLVDAAAEDTEFAAFLLSQQNLFLGEKQNLETQLQVFQAQLQQLEAEIEGRRQEIAGADEQLQLVGSELSRLTGLVDKALLGRSDIAELERLESDFRSRRSQSSSLLAQAQQRITQVRLNLEGAPEEFQRIVADQLSQVNLQLAQLRERVRAGQDIVDRTTVRAPVAGTVLSLRPNTPNAIIGAGQPILDIVPTDANLVVNARLSPIDIDTVHVGLQVEVHVLSFVARNTLPLKGVVTKVSADALVEPNTGATYYAIEIAIDQSTVRAADREIVIAGMPVEVFIFTGTRTFLEYIATPIAGSFRRSFRDS
jgi:HlyD family type I secretion membrane fusion protein